MHQQTATARAIQWAAAHPAEMAWLEEHADRDDFAASLASQLAERGGLSPRQEQALADKARGRTEAKVLNVSAIIERFAVARERGVEKPAMRLGEFSFKYAGDSGNNAGAIYVRASGDGGSTYLGKVLGGRFLKTAECTAEQEAGIVAVAADPDEAARAYGQRTGKCSICGIKLTAEASIDSFVGPICASKFGLPWGKNPKTISVAA